MARITVEDCLVKENNRFALVQLAAKRTKQLLQGASPLITEHRDNKSVVISLREIADGKVRFMTAEEAAHYQEELPVHAEPSESRNGRSYEQNGGSYSKEALTSSANGLKGSSDSSTAASSSASGNNDEDDGL